MLSYLCLGQAGSAYPASYRHADGGVYRGQWRGRSKQGLGVYRYPSGAQYQGEWLDNQKHGRGIYTYPNGGLYQGEWSGGERHGKGVRSEAMEKLIWHRSSNLHRMSNAPSFASLLSSII